MITKETPKEIKAPTFKDDCNRQGYEKLACEYGNWFKHWIESSKMPRPTSILDVGCRSGASTLNFLQSMPGAEVIGIDIEPDFVMEACERGALVRVQDVQTVDEMGIQFDYAFVSQVLEHVPDPVKAIKALGRCVRLAMFVSVPIESEDSFRINDSHLVRMEDEWAWLELFKEEWLPMNVWFDIRMSYLNFAVIKRGIVI